jgi:hypothetical protein
MPAISLAEFLQGAAAAAAALRLFSAGLTKTQAALFSFLVFNAIGLIALGAIPVASPSYFWSFIGYSALNWAISLWAAREMFELSLSAYPGIRSAARWTLYAAVAMGAAVSLAGIVLQPGRNGRAYFYYFQIADRSIVFSLALIVLALLAFLSRYPLHLSRNTYVSCSCFSAVLILEALADLVDSFTTALYSGAADLAEVLICGASFLFWALLLRTETNTAPAKISFPRADEGELLRQLESMNQLLTRAGRR